MSRFKFGDVVYVARGNPCCGGGKESVGKVFVVGAIEDISQWLIRCTLCGNVGFGSTAVGPASRKIAYLEERLEKFRPLEEDEKGEIVDETRRPCVV